METTNYLDSQTECLGAINATLRRQTHAFERLAEAIENIEQQGTKEQEAN
ncbi:hypothetical protein OAE76_01015 [bacterium]|nr:hypothetical protein [bacterium]